ncbi:MAG: tripartite tricarboxylate transporter permease [Thermoplasmatota archaeon]
MTPLTLLFVATIFSFLGIGLGIITGLIPGIHVNTISFLIVASQAALIGFVLKVVSGYDPSLSQLLAILSTMVLGCLISHTFLNFIPSTYLGAPEGETALSVLPAHEMMLEGRGYEAIKASAFGSFGAAVLALLFLLPARVIMGPPVDLYEMIVPIIPYVLIMVVSILTLQEGRSLLDYKPKLKAVGVFFLSGFLGLIILMPRGLYTSNWFPYSQPGVSPTSLMLFPLFTGLFGISTLIVSLMDNPDIPEQITEKVEIKLPKKNKFRGIITGTFSGGLVGWLPGITAAAATAVTKVFTGGEGKKEEQNREYIIAVSAVDTSCAIFTLIALFVILRARSGAMQAILDINEGNIDVWMNITSMPWLMALLLYSVILSSVIAFLLTLYFGKLFSCIHQKIEYRKMSKGIILFLIVMMFIFSGPLGLFIGLISTCIGLIPPLVGIKRVHMMGCLIFPIIIFLTGVDSYLTIII